MRYYLKKIKAMCRSLVILFVGFVYLMSCSSSLERNDYVSWVRDYKNGLHIKSIYNDFVFDLQYQPKAYLDLLRENRPLNDDLQYYVLNLSIVDPGLDFMEYNVSDVGEKQRRLYYFSYLFQSDIFLEEHGERFPCVLFHFEQSTLNNGKTFVLGFERSGSDGIVKESKLIVDSSYFGSLPIKIKVNKDNIPSVKL